MSLDQPPGQHPIEQRSSQHLPVQASQAPVQPVWSQPVLPSRAGPVVLAVIGIMLAGLALLAVFWYLNTFL